MRKPKGSTGTSMSIEKLTEKQKSDRRAYFAMMKKQRPKYSKPIWPYIPSV